MQKSNINRWFYVGFCCLSPCERVDWNLINACLYLQIYVFLHAREWIEIIKLGGDIEKGTSFSMRESGLKYILTLFLQKTLYVFLHAREWIEILEDAMKIAEEGSLSPCERVDWNRCIIKICINTFVFLHAREWIEIRLSCNNEKARRSFSMRESGLKFYMICS